MLTERFDLHDPVDPSGAPQQDRRDRWRKLDPRGCKTVKPFRLFRHQRATNETRGAVSLGSGPYEERLDPKYSRT